MNIDISYSGQIIIAVLGIAYPIILQLITRLNDTYNSSLVVKIFEEEFDLKAFKVFLFISIISIFIWSLNLKPIEALRDKSWLIDNSANMTVFISSFILTLYFLKLIQKVFTYYSPVKLTPYLLKRYKKKNKSDLFNAIGDLLIFTAKTNKTEILNTLLEFFHEEFKQKRIENNGNSVVYPTFYYSLINTTVKELAKKGIERNPALEFRSAGTIWLLGEISDDAISDNTYDCMWNNLITGFKYDQNSIFSAYWETSFYYFFNNLNHKEPKYDQNYNVINQKEIDEWTSRRENFLDFQLYVGGLVMFMKNQFALEMISNFTNMQPANYLLTPKDITSVFSKYVLFHDPFENNFKGSMRRFYFPGLRGMSSENVKKQSICDFLVFICLKSRLFYNTNNQPNLPKFPNKQPEIRRWLDSVESFKESTVRVFNDFRETNLFPSDFSDMKTIEDYLKLITDQLNSHYTYKANTALINEQKKVSFFTKTAEIFEDNFKDFLLLSRKKSFNKNYSQFEINGSFYIFEKDPFTEHPETHHVNYDSFISTDYSKRCRNQFLNSFEANKNKSYVLKEEDILDAVLELKLSKKYVVLDFGLGLRNKILNSRNKKKYTRQILETNEIIEINGFYHKQESFFVLKKKDLPEVIMKDIKEEDISKLSLEKISEKYKIYSSIIDFNNMDQGLIKQYGSGHDSERIKSKVLIHLSFNYIIKWKNNITLIQIYQYSSIHNNSLTNKLEDIESV